MTDEPRIISDKNLRGTRITASDLSGVIARGVVIGGAEIDSPWLLEGGATLVVNGVDVVPFVDAELDRRFPGRALRTAEDPDGLRAAWAALEQTWAETVARVAAMPAGTVDESVEGEWSFAQTLRHLIMATDMWLGRAVLGRQDAFHPIGLLDDGTAADGGDIIPTLSEPPTYDEVLQIRAERMAMVRDFLAATTADELAEQRPNPHAPQHAESVLSCVRTILEEEWEHHRYAVRDLDTLTGRAAKNPA